MWKYIAINSLWFSILLLVNFFGSAKDRKIVLASVFFMATYLAVYSQIDPFAWFCYLAFSVAVYRGAFRFRNWVFAKSVVVSEELAIASKQLEKEKANLEDRNVETGTLLQKANEIIDLYDRVKEMSKSLDRLETFLVFGEALAAKFDFQLIKLVFFNEDGRSEEIYELGHDQFIGLFDRQLFLKERNKAKGTLFPFDQKVAAHLAETGRPLRAADSLKLFGQEGEKPTPFIAYPIFLNEKLFAALTIIGAKDNALLYILVERFLAELQRVKLYERVQTLATTDGMTGVYVLRHLMERLEGEVDRSRRFGLKLSFLMVDIDHFKKFNDQYGHLVGDVVLRQVAQSIKKSIREVDLVGRYGGEEFGVLLIETDETSAARVAERIRSTIEERNFSAYDENLRVTVSIGCTTVAKNAGTAGQIIDSADSALYRAKHLGRNRVCLSNMQGP